MLDRVKLTCFQQHRDLEVTMSAGLTAIRGANEAGKSTLLRGICYALFGAKAMPDTLENLVTWGEEVKKLKAEVDFTADGVKYNVRRGKSGAELNYDGGKVVGQNEVTAKVCALLKVDAAAAARLMLSNQNEIRGALEAGPKETTALIERLSNFDQLDDLVKLIGDELTTGNEGTAVDRVQSLKDRLVTADEACVAPDLDALGAEIAEARDGLVAAQLELEEAQGAADAAAQALADGKVAAGERQAILDVIAAAGRRIDAIDSEMQQLATITAPDNVEDEIQRRRDAIEADARLESQRAAKARISAIYDEVVNLRRVPAPVGDVGVLRAELVAAEREGEIAEKHAKVRPYMAPRADGIDTFHGTIDDIEAAITVARTGRLELERLATKSRADAAVLRAQLTQGSCGFCGQDFSNVPEVQAKNSTLQAEIDALERSANERWAKATEEGLEQDRLQCIRENTLPVLRALGVVGADYAALADEFLPPVLKWVGPVYSEASRSPGIIAQAIRQAEKAGSDYDRAQTRLNTLLEERERLAEGLPDTLPAPADVKALRREVRLLEGARDAYNQARVKAETLAAEHQRLEIQIAEADNALDDHPAVDLAPLQAAADAARSALPVARRTLEMANQALSAANLAKAQAVERFERAKVEVASLKEQLKEREQELKDLRFNNKLLKDVRAARPVISDKLWNMVLGAVSRYFSDMRGRPSIVTKGQDGFMVDGKVVSKVTLSGSTLDILGLAIRVALVKTFLPECPFFVLDEPAQGCDNERTVNLLTFLSACGFRQVLLVTHEDTSQSVAQNMITLGA